MVFDVGPFISLSAKLISWVILEIHLELAI